MAEHTIFPGLLEEVREQESGALDPVTELQTTLDSGACPWCGTDGYDGDYPERHARRAHPSEWQAYKEA